MHARVLEVLAEPRRDPEDGAKWLREDGLTSALRDLDPDFASVCDNVSRALDDLPSEILFMCTIFSTRWGNTPARNPGVKPKIAMETLINRNGTLVIKWGALPDANANDIEYLIASGNYRTPHRFASIYDFMAFTGRATRYGAEKLKRQPGYTNSEWRLMETVRHLFSHIAKTAGMYADVIVIDEMFIDRTSPETSAPYIPRNQEFEGVGEFLSERRYAFLPPDLIRDILAQRAFAELTRKTGLEAEQILSAHKISGCKPKKTIELLGTSMPSLHYRSLRNAIDVLRQTQPELYARYFPVEKA